MAIHVFREQQGKITYHKEHLYDPGPNTYRDTFPKGDIWLYSPLTQRWRFNRMGRGGSWDWVLVSDDSVPAILRMTSTLMQ